MDIHFRLASEIDPIAVVALFFSLVSGLFTLIVWWKSGARIRFVVLPDMEIYGMPGTKGNIYISFRVTNIGGQPVTVKGIYAKHWKSEWQRFLRRRAICLFFPFSDAINSQVPPLKLDTGDEWNGVALQEPKLEKMLNGCIVFEVAHSMSQKPVRARIKHRLSDKLKELTWEKLEQTTQSE